mmetsp:Transcript_1162/g.1535  ORF Transcript_1162/g.1535 Transcript_1162/m.1535 type:complete len:147 (+) Transcript_1162:167-607(+)
MSPMDFYISQMYQMTTTMTTIGYGDMNAAKVPEYENSDNMTLIFFLQFIAIFTFSLIQDRLFSLHFDVTLQQEVGKMTSEMTIFMNEIDIILRRSWEKRRKNTPKGRSIPERVVLDQEVWDSVIMTVETSVRHSCYEAFIEQPFYS